MGRASGLGADLAEAGVKASCQIDENRLLVHATMAATRFVSERVAGA
jgi:hypothetical protein